MLERLGASERALFGHVTDQDGGNTARLGKGQQLRCGLANLTDRSWNRLDLTGMHGLDGVNGQHCRTQRLGLGKDAFEARLSQNQQALRAGSQPLSSQCYLSLRLLPADIKHALPCS